MLHEVVWGSYLKQRCRLLCQQLLKYNLSLYKSELIKIQETKLNKEEGDKLTNELDILKIEL